MAVALVGALGMSVARPAPAHADDYLECNPCANLSGPNEDPINDAKGWNQSGKGLCVSLWRYNGGSSYTLIQSNCSSTDNEQGADAAESEGEFSAHGDVKRWYECCEYHLDLVQVIDLPGTAGPVQPAIAQATAVTSTRATEKFGNATLSLSEDSAKQETCLKVSEGERGGGGCAKTATLPQTGILEVSVTPETARIEMAVPEDVKSISVLNRHGPPSAVSIKDGLAALEDAEAVSVQYTLTDGSKQTEAIPKEALKPTAP